MRSMTPGSPSLCCGTTTGHTSTCAQRLVGLHGWMWLLGAARVGCKVVVCLGLRCEMQHQESPLTPR